MMRWLKDKKKDKRSSSVGCDEDSKEDDYGFDKDKSASKSPVTRRQLPPTPLTPEERSPHIYEEIHDLQMVAALPQNGKASPQKYKKYKHSASGIGLASGNIASSVASSSSSSKYTRESNIASSSKDDSISPYMVVPVDEEVRQTPTSFHRDGTPEVHCDVIVKDTHCEILLSRKPKVSAFRLDSTGGSECNSVSNAIPAMRNNTHFCSRNRRASVDVHSAGGKSGSSSGAWNSSAFSSSSTSRVNSVGTSMMSLSTLSERHPGLDDNGSSGSSGKGVMTYTAASNFIARATKLAFNPLKPIDGDDTSLSNQDPFFSMMPPPPTQPQPQQPDLNNANFKTIPSAQDNSDKPVLYSSIPNANPNSTYPLPNSSQPHSRSHVESATTTMSKFNDSASCNPLRGYSSDKPFHSVNIVRATSPSDSSSCTYASVSFPTEPKVYNTIAPDLISQETTRQLQSHTVMGHLESSVEGESETESVRYSSIQETPFRNSTNVNATSVQYEDEDSVYSGVLPFRINGNANTTSSFCANLHHFSQIDQNQHCTNNNLNLTQTVVRNGPIGLTTDDNTSADIIYSGVVNHCETNNNNTVYACIENADIDQSSLLDNVNNNNVTGNDNLDTSEADVDRILYGQAANSVVLDFCTCSDDQHSTACGFLDLKQDDDTSSIATTINEARGSCTGCGRLIRQITYSESYSDETYEHVYSSRLLVRKGRRFSSPDITLSEISNSEATHGFDNVKGHESIGPMSRDDSWTARNDVSSTFYRPMDCGSKDGSSLFLNVRELKGNSQVQPKSYTGLNSSSQIPQRQSFPAYGQTSNSQNVTPSDKSNTLVNLAHHRPSLPVSLPSNLIPVPSNSIPSSAAVSQLQPKSSAFSNLLSKFSRPKSKHSVRNEAVVESVKPSPKSEDCKGNNVVDNQDSDVTEQIPEKNTTKLSKFFQRLSTNDPEGTESLIVKDKKRDDTSKVKGLKVDVTENLGKIPKMLRSPLETKSENLNHKDYSAFKYNSNNLSLSHTAKENFKTEENTAVCLNFSTEANRTSNRNNTGNSSQTNETAVDEMSSKATAVSNGLDHGAASTEPSSKPQNKTDSGDTCYEYDISTSSESEQTGYDYFLSKVKKSLNLEQEVQQIADMNALRRKLFCKKCKKNSAYNTTDNEDYESFGSDAGCPHSSSAKYGDLRKIFGDIVVDQRAAILDCLTNYAHGPFNVKCDGRENMCRECGCEIMTSDSESMTTVYSILSQQFRMTSPGTHTPSCDSDDGTMADNSCESADEGDNDLSSGYDEAVGPVCEYPSHKVKKREKSRDKKERRAHHSGGNVAYRDQERSKKKTAGHGMHHGKRYHWEHPDLPCARGEDKEKCIVLDKRERVHSTDSLLSSSIPSSQGGKNSLKKEMKTEDHVTSDIFNNSSNDNNDDDNDDNNCDQYKHDEICNKPRPSLMTTDRVIQDIYAPLPSKALSWLTARNCEPRSGASCCCARPPQSSASKLIRGLDSDKGTSVPPTASVDNAGTRKSCGMSYAGHTTDNGLNLVQTHCECSIIQDQTGSCATRGKEEHYKSSALRTGLLNSDKLSSMNEVEKFEFNSALCHFECSIDKGGGNTNSSPKSSEHALHTIEKPSLYSTYGIDNVVKESYLSVESSHHVPARVVPSALESKDGPGADTKEKRNRDNIDIVHEKKSEMQSLVLEVDVNQFKRQDGLMSRHKQKQLQMAALDLLPETALGGDTDIASECARPEVKAKSQRVKSNMVEKLAKLFEENGSSLATKSNNKNTGNDERVISITMTTTTPITTSNIVNINKHVTMETTTSAVITATTDNNSTTISSSSSKFNTVTFKTKTDATPTAAGNKIHGVTKFIDNNNSHVKSYTSTSSSPPSSSSSATATTPTPSVVADVHQGQKPGSISHTGSIVKIPLHPPATADHPVSTIYHGRSSQDKNNDQVGKSLNLNINAPETSSKLSGSLKSQGLSAKSKSDKRREAKDEKTTVGSALKENGKSERRSESRARKQIVSPSPSSSSGSSSRRRSHTRQKKLSKRSHLHKRTRSKSERRKNHHHETREERTVYYFSSDLSDIDTVEVEDWETYSSARSRDKSKAARNSAKPEMHGRSFEKDGKSKKAQDSSAEQGEECVIQEIYSIPPSSSEIRGVAAAAARTEEGSSSPQPGTPELAKANKSKKTDIYKTKRNNNKLLSDLIIRNYDRQMYDVGSNV